jgi:hypothetical protein
VRRGVVDAEREFADVVASALEAPLAALGAGGARLSLGGLVGAVDDVGMGGAAVGHKNAFLGHRPERRSTLNPESG